VRYPGFQRDIVALGVVRDVTLEGGRAIIVLDPGAAVSRCCKHCGHDHGRGRQLEGIASVEVRIADAARGAPASPFDERAPLAGRRARARGRHGKGGVGKSSVAVSLAVALRERGGASGSSMRTSTGRAFRS